MKTIILSSALAASALAFGGVDCDEQCGGGWQDCVDEVAECQDLVDCFWADGDLESCGGLVSGDVLDVFYSTVLLCYGECEDPEDEMPAENPYVFNFDGNLNQGWLMWFSDDSCQTLVEEMTCEVDEQDDGSMEYNGYFFSDEGEIFQAGCSDDTCSECDTSLMRSITAMYGPSQGDCFCDVGDDSPGMCVMGEQ